MTRPSPKPPGRALSVRVPLGYALLGHVFLGLALAAPGGCVGVPGPVAERADPAPGARAVRVPTAPTAGDGRAGTLILGLQ